MIIFDLDGTLWDTTSVTYEAGKIMSKRHKELKEFSVETIRSGMGLSHEENAVHYMPYLDQKQGIKYLLELIGETLKQIEKKGANLYDGVEDTIRELSKKYKLGIVTNNNDEYAKLFMKSSNLENYFTDYIGAGSHNITKAEAIRQICKRNNEPNSIYVGDIKKDMIATEEAGITFVHAKYGFEPSLKTKYQINNIKELEQLIDKIKEY